MKKQIFTIILLLMGGVTAFGQFIIDGGTNPIRLRTDGITKMYIAPNSAIAPVLPGNIGIGTISPPAKLTVAGDMALQKIQRETVAGGYNDYDRQEASIVIFENGGTIGGIQGGSKGQMLYVLCGYGNNQSALTIKHESAGNPTAANRILTHTGADFVITAGAGGVLLIYDDTKARWRIVETPSGSGTAGWGLTGNSGTNPATNYIGTSNAQDLVFKTNSIERMRVDADVSLLTLKSSSNSYNRFGGYKSLGTDAAPTLVTNGTDLASFVGYGYSGSTYRPAAGIIFQSTRRFINDEIGGRIIFSTTGSGTGPLGISGLERMRIEENGWVGIGTNTPTAKLDVDGDIVVRKTTITTTGAIDALNRNGASSIYFTGFGTITLRGIAGGQDGMLLYIFTAYNTTLNLINESSPALSADQIATNTAATVTISGRGGATLIYDSAISKWRIIGIAN